jgi:hypothetical protein
MRVAILLAEQVRLSMVAWEIKNVNCKTNILEDWVVLDHFSKCAIVVKEYVVWHEVTDPIGSNDHLLVILVNERCGNSQQVARLMTTLDIASALKNVSLAMISPHGTTNICSLWLCFRLNCV